MIKHITGIVALVIIVAAVAMSSQLFETNSAGYVQVKQTARKEVLYETEIQEVQTERNKAFDKLAGK